MGSFYELLDKWYCPSSKSKLKLSWPYFQLLSISLSPRTINILKEWCTVVSLLCHLASTSQSIPIIFWYVHSPWRGALYNFLTFQILKSSLCCSLLLSLCLPQNSTEIINSTFLKKLWLIYNVVLVSSVLQSDSVIYTYIFILKILFSSGLSQNIE